MKKSRLLGAVCACLLTFITSLANAATLNTELVINGGAETGDTTGWLSAGIDAVMATGFAAGFGSFVFTGGGGVASQTLTQTIDLSGNAAQIDTNSIEAIFSIQLQSRSVGSALDQASVDVSFLDGGGSVLDSYSFTDIINTALFDWNEYSDARTIANGARSIKIVLTSDRINGSSSDGFIDEVSLQINAINSVPVPAAVWLFGSGLLGLIGVARRKKA